MDTSLIIVSVIIVATISFHSLLFVGRSFAALAPSIALIMQLISLTERYQLLGAYPFLWARIALMLDIGSILVWFYFIQWYNQGSSPRVILAHRALAALGGLALLAVGVAPIDSLLIIHPSLTGPSMSLLFAGKAIMAAAACIGAYELLMLESVIMSAEHGVRWRIKLVLVGVGAALAGVLVPRVYAIFVSPVFLIDFFHLRVIAIILGGAFILYGRIRRENAKFKVSRQVAYKSVILFIVGAYLVLLGLAKELEKVVGFSTGVSLLLVVAFLLTVALVILFLSESLQRKVKGVIHKHFYEEKYDYRSQWMAFTDTLAKANRPDFLKVICAAYCETFGLSGAALYIRSEDGSTFSLGAAHEMSLASFREIESQTTEIERFLKTGSVLPLAPSAGGSQKDELLSQLHGHEVYFLVPMAVQGRAEGFLALGRPLDLHEHYGPEDFDLMTAMSQQAASTLANQRLTDSLAVAREMEALGRISAFIAHDIKNHVYSLSLLLENARNYIDNPEFQEDMLNSLGNITGKMKVLVSQLKSLPTRESLHLKPENLRELADSIVAEFKDQALTVSGDPVTASIDREALGKVLLNVVLNAIEATNGRGVIAVTIASADSMARIDVEDNGPGMSESFIKNELFRPMRTTKRQGLGIGLYQCKFIMDAHGGAIDVRSEPGRTVFSIRVPVDAQAPHRNDSYDRTEVEQTA